MAYLWLAALVLCFQFGSLLVENAETKKVFYKTIIFGSLLTTLAGVLTGHYLALLWLIVAFISYKTLKNISE